MHAFVKLEPTAEGEPAHKLDDRETRERRLELPPHPLKRKGPALTSKGFGSHLTEWMIMPPAALLPSMDRGKALSSCGHALEARDQSQCARPSRVRAVRKPAHAP